ncbi:MAG: YccF domain-containing protein [Coriobacteriia bacterium]|nr:YccF domain-containing protein [Coriobacteriia bacterium]MCL2745751.1 YccF domain-containing protein [Coriobacteriia bacterium]MCL2870536.1 YccF domain-containing protein [Coriobacteriia bacterium]
MKTLGNIIWFIFGGLPMGLSWVFIGVLWCVTIVGIPIGKQCFKLASVAFFPFKKEVELGGGAPSVLLNVLWIIFGGFMLALEAFLLGVLFCITIIGIPFGKQCFKLAKLSLAPFGAEVVRTP